MPPPIPAGHPKEGPVTKEDVLKALNLMGSCRAEDLALVLKVPKRWLIIVLLRMVGKTVSRHKRATDLPRGQGNKREVYYYEAYGTKAAPSTSLQSFFGAIIRPVEIDETQDS